MFPRRTWSGRLRNSISREGIGNLEEPNFSRSENELRERRGEEKRKRETKDPRRNEGRND